MKNKLIFIAFFVFYIISLSAENPFLVYFETSDTLSSTSIKVDVKVRDYVDVYGAQMYMTWDSSVYTYDTIIDVNPVLGDFVSNNRFYYYEKNNLAVGWSDLGIYHTLSDETTIFSVILNVVGAPCDSTTLKVIDLSDFYRSLATFELNNDILEDKIRYEQNVFTIPGGDCMTRVENSDSYSQRNDFYVYPNPMTNRVNIVFEGSTNDDYKIEFFTLYGIKVYTETFSKNDYNCVFHSSLSSKNIPDKLVFIRITDSKNNIEVLKALLE